MDRQIVRFIGQLACKSYNIMGNKNPVLSIEQVNPTETLVYAIGKGSQFPPSTTEGLQPAVSAIIARNQSQSTASLTCKIRIKDTSSLAALYPHCNLAVHISKWKEASRSILILAMGDHKISISGLTTILRKEMKISDNETVYIYKEKQLCPRQLVLQPTPNTITSLIYSQMQFAG